MTPSELKKIKAAVASAAAALLAREENDDVTAESLAEELAESVVSEVVSTYEEIQAKAYNLVVVAQFRPLQGAGPSYMAAVGPLSTRAKARAREVGERFAWDYKTRRGNGGYVLVPLIRDPSQAWDEARAAHVEVIKERAEEMFSLSANPFGPACTCGLPDHPRYNSLGDEAVLTCPLHPEGRNEGDS